MKLAIITARGGSKRIPKKNIKDFCGKPIISYSIEAALASQLFDEVMVSTDSEEIAKIAEYYGAKVPFFRSANASNDYATTSDVLVEVLLNYHQKGYCVDEACCIYPTAPFITAEKLKKSLNLLESEEDIDTVVPVVEFSYPPQRGLIMQEEKLVMREPQYSRARSQDLPKIYHDAGQFYFFKVEPFLNSKNLMNGRIEGLVLSEMEVQDIDTENDWKLAELKYSIINKGHNNESN